MRRRPHSFDPYLAAHQRAYSWAEKVLRYRCGGNLAQAEAALEKVEHRLHKVVVLGAWGVAPRSQE
jgi:hypothetical protein